MTELFSNFEFVVTLSVFLACAAVVGVMSCLERRPRKGLTPLMFPTTPIMLIFGFIALLAVVHLANMYGIHTGRSRKF